MRHLMGASQDTDELVVEFPENPRLYVTPELTHDGRYLVLHISEGTSEKNRLWVCPVSTDSGAAIIASRSGWWTRRTPASGWSAATRPAATS